MARIIIKREVPTEDLADKFIAALNSLKELGLNPRVGTKLLTRYAVVEVDDACLNDALAKLQSANLATTKEPL